MTWQYTDATNTSVFQITPSGGTEICPASSLPSGTTILPAASPVIDYVGQALSALAESDKTILRCYENGVAVPSAWATYRASLRSIVSTGSGALPTKPSYPTGT